MSTAYEAMIFAREAHKDQKRKYTGNPYADHLAEVAGISVTACPVNLRPDVMAAVAWLHDGFGWHEYSNYSKAESAIVAKWSYNVDDMIAF